MRVRGLVRTAALCAVAVALAACSSSGDAAPANDAASSAGTVASTGGLDPQPLAEPTTLKVTMALRAEAFSAVLLADQMGELAKENLSVEYVFLPSTEALPALATGKTDVAAAGITASLFNGIHEGADIRLVLPGPKNNVVDGLWVRKDATSQKLDDVTTIGSSSGAATTAVVPIARYLASVGQDITQTEFTTLPIADLPIALEEGAVSAAWLNSPAQVPIEKAGTGERVVTYGPQEYGTGYAMGPNLLKDRPEVAQAFVRALARTEATYLSGDYKANPDTVAALATALEAEPAEVTSTPSMTFDTVLDTAVFDEAQRIWLSIGDLLSFSEPMPDTSYVDRTFVDTLGSTS